MGRREHDMKESESASSGSGSDAEPTLVSTRGAAGSRPEDTLASKRLATHSPQSADPNSLAQAIDRLDATLEQLELRIATVEQVTNTIRSPKRGERASTGSPVAIIALVIALLALAAVIVLWAT